MESAAFQSGTPATGCAERSCVDYAGVAAARIRRRLRSLYAGLPRAAAEAATRRRGRASSGISSSASASRCAPPRALRSAAGASMRTTRRSGAGRHGRPSIRDPGRCAAVRRFRDAAPRARSNTSSTCSGRRRSSSSARVHALQGARPGGRPVPRPRGLGRSRRRRARGRTRYYALGTSIGAPPDAYNLQRPGLGPSAPRRRTRDRHASRGRCAQQCATRASLRIDHVDGSMPACIASRAGASAREGAMCSTTSTACFRSSRTRASATAAW